MEIVELSPGDVRRLASDLAQLLLDAHASNMALGLAAPLDAARARRAWLETAERLGPDRVLLAACEGPRVVGSVQLVRAAAENGRHRGEIQRLTVLRERRGEGLGRALLDAAAERARADGLSLLWLQTHADTGADRFYEATGWTRAGVIPSYAVRPDGTLSANAFYFREL